MRPETRKESFLDELIYIQKGKWREKRFLKGSFLGGGNLLRFFRPHHYSHSQEQKPLAGQFVNYFEALAMYVETIRTKIPQDSYIQNEVDTVVKLIQTTKYKLINLK